MMTTHTSPCPHQSAASLESTRLQSALAALTRRWHAWRRAQQRRRTAQALSQLNVRDLQDIGAPDQVIDQARAAATQQHWVQVDRWRL